ncbi:MAG: STAS domain-containing protein [Burkholderiaceae bacterium]|nr:STAS domain-containing protein [Burkholderiaceae bacterium]
MVEHTESALRISGEFSILTAQELKQYLLDAVIRSETPEIKIDLSEVTEFDSAGLQLMVMTKREAERRGKYIRFEPCSATVLDLLALCDLVDYFSKPIMNSTQR